MFERSFKLLKARIRNEGNVLCSGLPGASKVFLIKALKDLLNDSFVIVVPSEELGRALVEDLNFHGVRGDYLPYFDVASIGFGYSSVWYEVFGSLYHLLDGKLDVLVIDPRMLVQKVPDMDVVVSKCFELKRGGVLDYARISDVLSSAGYVRVEADPDEGEFVLIGDTLKVILPQGKTLVVDLFGDTIERISVDGFEVDRHVVFPLSFDGAGFSDVMEYFSSGFSVYVEPFQCIAVANEFMNDIRSDYEMISRKLDGIVSFDDMFGSFSLKFSVGILDSGGSEVDFGIERLPYLTESNVVDLLKLAIPFDKLRVVCSTAYMKELVLSETDRIGLDVDIRTGISLGSYIFKEAGLIHLVELPAYSKKPGKASVVSISPGEFVVHRDYGIGRFLGIVRRNVNGRYIDFFEIEYADGEKLFAPFTQIDRIYRYSGFKGRDPRLYKLGSVSWRNLEKRVKASLENFARSLADLYSKRKSLKGISLKGDPEIMRQFEEAFPYKETTDQLRTLKEIYADMESELPMDRLVCGDVGFGKTEVAMRAAMKAVSSGKQVAVLAPTTILVEQHYRNFKERFKDFPVKIEMLSRFVSRDRQRYIIDGIKNGIVDIVIGTHMLTSDSVDFNDLGLLIIDEEHRFGVRTKEKIATMKKNIDVLYLSATPIPRTLYSSLSGFRDISLIRTPPYGRKGTKVFLFEYSDKLFMRSIDRELGRGGQVFVVCNNIDELSVIKSKISSMFPKVSVDVVHGRMRSNHIEEVMHGFISGDIRILVATAIVESGIDIPSANTLIVLNPERFGLSQLYQLKGRVGRGSEKGYCYLFVKSMSELTPDAAKRLDAIVNTPDIGGGFELALKDLEIRGAGNLLGPQQSGYINSIGFELYLKLFEELVEKRVDEDVKVNVPFEAFIPEDYVSDTRERLKLYTRLAEDASDSFLDYVRSLYGVVPDPVVNMFNIMKIKQKARSMGVSEVTLHSSGSLVIKFGEPSCISPDNLVRFVQSHRASLSPDGYLCVPEINTLDEILDCLDEISM